MRRLEFVLNLCVLAECRSFLPTEMIFIYNDCEYCGETAVEVVRAVERDTNYRKSDGSVRDFLVWSLERMDDRIPERELDVSPNLSDEAIAYDFLYLLDRFGVGALSDSGQSESAKTAGKTRRQQRIGSDDPTGGISRNADER
jgi:hypothetical protein